MSAIYTPLLLEDIKRTADLCVKCNICTSACPVVPVTDLFPGPKFVGPQAQRFRDPGLPSPDHSLDYCSGCGVCTLVCPHGVKVMEINTAAKAELRTRQFRENPLNLRWWRNTAFGYNEVLGQVGGTVAPLTNAVMGFKPVRMLMEKTLGIDHRAPFPTFHFNKFRGWFFGQHQREQGPIRPNAPKVAYFHGCATQHYEMEVGKAIVAVLEHNGFEVVLPEQNCCGLPMQSDYRELLGIHTAEAKLVAEHVYDINEFLWLQHEAGRLQTDFKPQTGRYIPYHTSCHQKLHRIGRPALDLLGLVPGLVVEEMGVDCCGITGTYGYKHEKYAIAQAVGKPLFEKIVVSGAPVAICDNETCRWNIAASTGVDVVHTVEVLADAYGLAWDV